MYNIQLIFNDNMHWNYSTLHFSDKHAHLFAIPTPCQFIYLWFVWIQICYIPHAGDDWSQDVEMMKSPKSLKV